MRKAWIVLFVFVQIFSLSGKYIGNGGWVYTGIDYMVGTDASFDFYRSISNGTGTWADQLNRKRIGVHFNFMYSFGAKDIFHPGIGIEFLGLEIVYLNTSATHNYGFIIPPFLHVIVPFSTIHKDRDSYYYPLVLHFFAGGYSVFSNGSAVSNTSIYEFPQAFSVNLGLDYNLKWIALGIEGGIIGTQYRSELNFEKYIGLNFKLFSNINVSAHKINHNILISGRIEDSDSNGVLQSGETGCLILSIENRDEGEISGIIYLEADRVFNNLISIPRKIKVNRIKKGEKKNIKVEIKIKDKIPVGELYLKATFKSYHVEKEFLLTSVPVVPKDIIKLVAFRGVNIDRKKLPYYIVPTSEEDADYLVYYDEGKIILLNSLTGEKRFTNAIHENEIIKFIVSYFSQKDKSPPSIEIVKTVNGVVKGKNIKIPIDFSDDVKVVGLYIYINDSLWKKEYFTDNIKKEYTIPLRMGDNKIEFRGVDWLGKETEKTIELTRIKGNQDGKFNGTVFPELNFKVKLIRETNVIYAYKDDGIIVTVENKGKGIAKDVRIVVEGDSSIVKGWGHEFYVGDIIGGRKIEKRIGGILPDVTQAREAQIRIYLKEGRGYSPPFVKEVTLWLKPKIRTDNSNVIVDVDEAIPKYKIKREDGYALIVGISTYSDDRIEHVKYADHDAEIFKKYAENILGIPEDNIYILTNEKATTAQIKGYITDRLKNKKGFKVFYFAGHGMPNYSNKDFDVKLLPYDGNPDLEQTIISVREISKLLHANPKDTVVMIFDACFSGGGLNIAQRPIEVVKIPKTSAITFASSEGLQPSISFDKVKHGYFTYYLLLGLKGKADSNKDGWITTRELYKYVRDNVEEMTDGKQSPVMRPNKDIKITKLR